MKSDIKPKARSGKQTGNLICIFRRQGLIFEYDPVPVTHSRTTSERSYRNDELVERSKTELYEAIYDWGFEESSPGMSPSALYVHKLAERFILTLTREPDIEFTRRAPEIDRETITGFAKKPPFAFGAENITNEWLTDLYFRLAEVFATEIAAHKGTVREYLSIKSKRRPLHIFGRIFFHLVESKDPSFPFAFLATYSTRKQDDENPSHIPLKNALIEYKGHNEKLLELLSTVRKAAAGSRLINEMVNKGEIFSAIRFTVEEAYLFLKEVPLYEECGIICRIPLWWKKTGAFNLTIEIGGHRPSEIGMDALLTFEPKMRLGEDDITRDEIQSLLTQASGLRMIKGKWVEVDEDKLIKALEAFDKAKQQAGTGGITFAEAMRMQLISDTDPGAASVQRSSILGEVFDEYPETSVTRGQWLNDMLSNLRDPKRLSKTEPGKGFKGTLRHYQQAGLDWLRTMRELGFGALLADDMGLGKTVQILAMLEYLRCLEPGTTSLLIVPASLIGNWEKEIQRFTPELDFTILHGQNRSDSSSSLFITSYGMVSRITWIRERKWDVLIADEAQAVKNPSTAQSAAVRKLNSSFKIAMTGTPIENRLSDLWSIFDYLNSGMLGTINEFDEYIRNINNDNEKIRELVNPFILRRLKTDKAIISDLPDKIEIKEYSVLTRRQTILYQQVISELKEKLENTEGIERKGLILSEIMKLKQLCNHPDQFLGQQDFDPEHSGKFDLLRDICETIREKRERVLVFTQFRQMTEPLSKFLEGVFGRKGLILHGGTSVKKRTDLVERMNGDEYCPYMILSLKAGGVGLNLTGACHVIHFDRWWNPAVENQATDRAFRIGQTRNVMVHKFITEGTIEEKIDSMIERKQQFAADIIQSTGEKWITEMSNEELMALFTIS